MEDYETILIDAAEKLEKTNEMGQIRAGQLRAIAREFADGCWKWVRTTTRLTQAEGEGE